MNGKRAFLFFALAFALALGAVSPALAHGRSWGPDSGAGPGAKAGFDAMHWLSRGALEDLKLTADQRQRIRDLFRETFPDRQERRNGLLRDTLADLRSGRALDPSARRNLENETAKRILDGTRVLAKLHAILTPEQRSILQSKLDRFGTARNEKWNWPGFSVGHLAERLNLTDAQKTRAEVLFKSWEKPMEARRVQMQSLGAEAAKRAFSPNPDFRRLEADARRLSELAVEGIFERSRHMEQFRSMLTEEQKKILDEGFMGRRPGKRPW